MIAKTPMGSQPIVTDHAAPLPAVTSASRLRMLVRRVTGGGAHGRDRLNAVSAFLTRVAGAGILYISQVLIARWVGAHEFGLYVYAWTLLVIAGELTPTGFVFASQRLIPELRHAGDHAALRGFLKASRLYGFGMGVLVAALAAGLVLLMPDLFRAQGVSVLVMAALALPPQALGGVQDGIARSFGLTNLGLMPPFLIRPLLILLGVGAVVKFGPGADAVTVAAAGAICTWIVVLGQGLILDRRIARDIPAGPADMSAFPAWLRIAAGMWVTWGFVTLFTYADVVVLNQFVPPDQVAVYYATGKTLALTTFVTFAIAAVVGHRFASLHVAGDREGLEAMMRFAVTWTFWPSLAITLVMLAAGRPILSLFGAEFAVGYKLLFILSAGMLARASVGPAERVLTMLGHQAACARVYAGAFAANLAFCLILIPPFGLTGAATAVSLAMFVEAGLLAWMVWRKLGLRAFVV